MTIVTIGLGLYVLIMAVFAIIDHATGRNRL